MFTINSSCFLCKCTTKTPSIMGNLHIICYMFFCFYGMGSLCWLNTVCILYFMVINNNSNRISSLCILSWLLYGYFYNYVSCYRMCLGSIDRVYIGKWFGCIFNDINNSSCSCFWMLFSLWYENQCKIIIIWSWWRRPC